MTGRGRAAPGAALLTAVLLAAGSCARPATGDGGAAAASPPAEAPTTSTSTTTAPTTVVPTTTTTTFPLAPVEPITWSSCGGGFECATLAVPVDHRDHDGPHLDLALVRRPAGDPDRRVGSLLVNPGGPGASGVSRVRRGFSVSPEVAERFDVIGFDPRGVGGSSPLGCGEAVAAFRAADLDPDDPAEEAALDAAARAVAEECEASDGDRLAHLGTIDVARDVELIRRALGEETVSFVGLSYGTLVGLLWADSHPASVRALVLDAVVDPAAGRAGASVEQTVEVDRAVEAIDEACSADPSCPLAERGLLVTYDELAARTEVAPLPGLGPTQLAYAAIMTTYDPALRPRLWNGLAAAVERDDPTELRLLAARFTSLVDYPAFALVSCLDSDHPVGYQAWQAAGDELARASPRFGRVIANELLPCAYWPPATLEPRTVALPAGPPALLIGSTGDAATPLDQATRVAARLGLGHLLVVESERHVSLSWNPCAQDAATRMLVDLDPPDPGARC